jgi:Ferritin-like
MKTIAQYVEAGISKLEDLQSALKVAMRLEFSTIPPYLCAQWSINDDPDDVDDLIRNIVIQEMYHFALAGNMLSAIKGVPDIARADFLPSYPTDTLPGDIHQDLTVDLKPLSIDQLKVFMQIENPQFPPLGVAEALVGPATIGEFYDTIAAGFDTVKPVFDPNARFVKMGEAVQIKTPQDAKDAIARIKSEGEGTPMSPDQFDGSTAPAHYYIFKEILVGKTFGPVSPGHWDFGDPPIRLPTVFNFAKSTVTPSPSLAFNQALSKLLIDLQACWTTGGTPSRQAMNSLEQTGRGLIQHGILPEFIWAAPSA